LITYFFCLTFVSFPGFYAEELQPINVKDAVYKIEKVLRKRKLKNGKTQLFVKWLGWDDTHNSWIDGEEDVTRVF
jgi:Chromo (CHRromatin Organisation MOdifier) domain